MKVFFVSHDSLPSHDTSPQTKTKQNKKKARGEKKKEKNICFSKNTLRHSVGEKKVPEDKSRVYLIPTQDNICYCVLPTFLHNYADYLPSAGVLTICLLIGQPQN